MRALNQKKVIARAVQKPKHPRIPAPKLDTRLTDAEQFLLPTYKRQPFVLTHGRGAYVYDSGGRKYLDFLGGIAVNALGHAHLRIVKVIRREAARAIHLSNLYHNAYQGPLARKLADLSGMDRVFFSNSSRRRLKTRPPLCPHSLRRARQARGEASHPGHAELLSRPHFWRRQRNLHGKIPFAVCTPRARR